ncbi:uncharacterized protein LOC113758280 isoform X2 [Coffea eugenioides]|uniref:DUF1618 domain-containing protein n=1 Tax=Coffea arabica TaxID=13443 RepID=A0A6P6SY75_COFAR|nr:uncharacterized protein LOC113758280 isoform X2 [Coffea eugenioides]
MTTMGRNRSPPAGKLRNKRQTKKARVADPLEEERSCIYVLVQDALAKEFWFAIDLNAANRKDGCGGGRAGAGLCARKLEMRYPLQGVHLVTFGSYMTLIYGLGGDILVPDPSCCSLGRQKILRSIYFYDTANPARGWVRGPDMIATRREPRHQVVDGKLCVLGGIAFSDDELDCCDQPRYVWAEYLDLSLPFSDWKWHPVDVPPGDSGGLLSEWKSLSASKFPLMKGKFDPQRHVLAHIGWPQRITVCYDVHSKLLSRVSDSGALSSYSAHAMFVDGDYVFIPDATAVLAMGVFHDDKDTRSAPWFQGFVRGMYGNCGRLPPPRFRGICPEDPDAFLLVPIAPFKYATVWSPDLKEEPCDVRLSVFTVSPPASPRLNSTTLRARFEVSDEHLPLGLPLNVRVLAAVAVLPASLSRHDLSMDAVLTEASVEKGTSSMETD